MTPTQIPIPERVQVYWTAEGGFAFKADGSPPMADQMLIARGLTVPEALELIEGLNIRSHRRTA
jgi:hypothetical protein